MFLFFAVLTLASAVVMAFHQSIVHSAFALVGTLFGVAGLYWVLGADFIGGLQVLLYVGGVTILILFAVMLTTRDTMRRSLFRYVLGGGIVGVAAVQVMSAYKGAMAVLGETPAPPMTGSTTEAIGNLLVTRDGHLLTFEVVAVLLLLVLIGAVTVARRSEGHSA